MEGWFYGMVLKPLIAVVLFVGLFGLAKLLATGIKHLLPEGRLKRELFATTVDELRPSGGAKPPDSLLK
jgi:hypothetical protein